MTKTTVNEAKTVKLVDGTPVEVRPLTIKRLREFMAKFGEIEKVAQDNEKSMTVLVECVQIAMRQYKPEAAESLEELEENIDLPTVYEIIEAASGINMANSPIVG
jgi:uncharacterized Fe-S radical SAM superfamily protein PflX